MTLTKLFLTIVMIALLTFTSGYVVDPNPDPPKSSSSPLAHPSWSGRMVQITLRTRGGMPTEWKGEVTASEGSVQLATGVAETDKISGKRWSLKSTTNQPAVLFAIVDAPNSAVVEVKTNQGNFEFALGDIRFGRPLGFVRDAVLVQEVPRTQALTDEPTEDDFPACVSAPDGTIWCAYLAYQHGSPIMTDKVSQGEFESLVTRDNGDGVRLLRFDGEAWYGPMDVTATNLDLWRPAVAVDGNGNVRVLWSQNMDGNWEILSRRYDPAQKSWSATERITHDPGADINVVATTSGSGKTWIAWQGWDSGRFIIKTQRLGEQQDDAVFSPAIGEGNQWNPSIAADARGAIHVAFDSYAAGNYDVYVWTLEQEGRVSQLRPIANSPRFEARPSIAIDKDDQIWVAFEDADPNWGKDYGILWEGKRGVPFYLDRGILVRCLSGGELKQTLYAIRSDPIYTVNPPSRRQRISFPRLQFDDSGRPWLLFRRHPLVSGGGERWVSYASYFDRDRWSNPALLQHSDNTLDNRPALVRTKSGSVMAVFSGDGRTRGTTTAVENNLYATELREGGNARAPILIPPPGQVLTVEPVHPDEAEDIRRIRSYRAKIGGKRYQLLRGEFHRHTAISSHRDQDGPFEEIWRYSLDVAQLDWIGPGDHDNGAGKEYPWWLTQKQIDMYHHSPVFDPMFTYERSVQYPSGHRNVMFARRGIRPLPRLGTRNQVDVLYGTPEAGSPDIKNLYAYLKHFDGICSSHTSATNMGTDWRDNDPEVEPVVEIYQGDRQNYEEPHAPKAAANAEDSIGRYEPAGFVWNAFAKGYRLGFQSSSDHVSTHISYGIVFAENHSREAILDAFKKRHCYAANDNIILDVRSGRFMMGDEFTLRSQPKLDITIEGTKRVTQIDIVRQIDQEGPAYVHSWKPMQRKVQLSWADQAPRAGAVHMYYVRIMQEDGAMAWASPMWIHYEK